jgi:cytochrome c oxidase subunit 2
MAVVLASCGDDKPLNMFEPRGPAAEDIDQLMVFIWPIMIVIGVLVVGGGIWLAIRNRVKPEDFDYEDLPEQVHGNFRLEMVWTILPGVLLAAICIPMVQGIWALEEENGPDDLDVMVIGQQWWWEYRYDIDGDGFFADGNGDGVVDDKDEQLPLGIGLDPDDVIVANELVVPAGQQVDLILSSRDVIHSYWIPRLNGKRDTVPGRWHTWSLEAFEPGKYTGWCTEFCGLSHARMRMSTLALPEAEFDAWLANQARPSELPTDEDALAGRDLFMNQCMSCHVITEDPEAVYPEGVDPMIYPENFEPPLTSGAAPNLTHFATRSVFAGAIYATYLGPGTDPSNDDLDVSIYLDLPELGQNPGGPDDYRWNAPELKRWISNAPSMKDMAPDDERGMLAFPQLTDVQLDQLVAYLATLD